MPYLGSFQAVGESVVVFHVNTKQTGGHTLLLDSGSDIEITMEGSLGGFIGYKGELASVSRCRKVRVVELTPRKKPWPLIGDT